MPIENCQLNGKPGFRYGKQAHCYTYTAGDAASREQARAKAETQRQAIKAQQEKKR